MHEHDEFEASLEGAVSDFEDNFEADFARLEAHYQKQAWVQRANQALRERYKEAVKDLADFDDVIAELSPEKKQEEEEPSADPLMSDEAVEDRSYQVSARMDRAIKARQRVTGETRSKAFIGIMKRMMRGHDFAEATATHDLQNFEVKKDAEERHDRKASSKKGSKGRRSLKRAKRRGRNSP